MHIEEIRWAIMSKQYQVSEHAEDQMDIRNILQAEVEEAIAEGEIIEEYPNHYLGSCCLILGRAQSGRYLHVVASLPPNCWIVTTYEPDPTKWSIIAEGEPTDEVHSVRR